MKKILFYINTIGRGGAERVITNIAALFAENSYECVFVTSFRRNGEYKLSSKIKRLSLENEEIKQGRLMRNLTRIVKLRRLCKEEKPDIVISFMAEPNFRVLLATIGLKCKTIISVRNDPNKEYSGKIGWFIGKYLLPFADSCVFQTNDAKKWFPTRLQNKGCVIINPVDPAFFNVKREPKKNLVVTCGRLTKQKNQVLLIDAFTTVVKAIPDAKLYIYGEGELHDSLQEKINILHLSANVFLKGQITDVTKALSHASLFVLPSLYEGLPNALMEAMAAGVPSISTDCPCGGPKMLINNGIDGLLVPVNDSVKLANAILSLLSEPERLVKLGLSASNKARSFLPEKIFMDWKNCVDKLSV